MGFLTVLFIAFGLSMDAFAVSIAQGFAMKGLRARHAFRIALFFGLFQLVMPIMGWSCGISIRSFISGVDHWIAFSLLLLIGAKMIYESTKLKEENDGGYCLGFKTLVILSVATSIDALAVGLSLSIIDVAIVVPAVIIGIVTFALSFVGVYIGGKFGHFFESKIEAIGGAVLICIGLKILLQHIL